MERCSKSKRKRNVGGLGDYGRKVVMQANDCNVDYLVACNLFELGLLLMIKCIKSIY